MPHDRALPYLSIISAMITPAVLMLTAGSLVSSTLTRIARIFDRACTLIDRVAAYREKGDERNAQSTLEWLLTYRSRVALAERALTMFYAAIGMFLAAGLAIVVEYVAKGAEMWIPLVLVVIGVVFLFVGSIALVIETSRATDALRREIERLDV
jgi:dolichyl-phosphate-mannose--protein O-mannosyl transferase